jgi:catechol 2,3-dioxygenase-like lactoylglutathione lyase family enzyme
MMKETPCKIGVFALIIDCRDQKKLSAFYGNLLGWDLVFEDENWSSILSPEGFRIAFQRNEEYAPPIWPDAAGKPGQMMHLDFQAKEHEAAVAHALSLGARKTPEQFYGDGCVTMLDPEGHPFCILREEH